MQIEKEIIIMATIGATKDDIKTDVRELAAIAVEDKIPKDIIKNYRGLAEIHYKDMFEERLKHDLVVSDITGINGVSKRFVDKLLFILSKYQQNEERRLILQCINLMVEDATKKR
ncbi:MAG: hypothetical protein ACJ72Q_07255 [Nitrososphaeraceae archaeon]